MLFSHFLIDWDIGKNSFSSIKVIVIHAFMILYVIDKAKSQAFLPDNIGGI